MFRVSLLCVIFFTGNLWAAQPDSTTVRVADAFDFPVGGANAGGYHKARGFRQNGHLGEDWNGDGGGDSDLGSPIACVANGIVIVARDVRLGWGNVVIVRHAFYEAGQLTLVDSLYGHLDRINVTEGQAVNRGQLVGTMGNNRGMYDAHLHFEIRKNLAIGMNRSAFARDFSNYYDPTVFIKEHRAIPASQNSTLVAVNTVTSSYLMKTNDEHAAIESRGPRVDSNPMLAATPNVTTNTLGRARGAFKIDRYSDIRSAL